MYKMINNNNDFDAFLENVNHLHDAILREFSLISRGYVDSARKMHGDVEPSDARVMFQLQSSKTPCVEVVFESVLEIRILPDIPIMPSGEISDRKAIFYIGGYQLNNKSKVVSEKIKYRVLNEKNWDVN